MDRKLIDYLPPILREVREYVTVMETVQPELGELWDRLGAALNDQFPAYAGADGIRRWEKLLGIVPKATDGLDDRRLRILSRIGERLPFTIRALRDMLGAIYGPGACEISVDPESYVFNCSVNSGAPQSARSELYGFLRRIVPANLPLLLSLHADVCVIVSADGHAYHVHTLMTGRHLTGTKPYRNLRETRACGAAGTLVTGNAFRMRARLCGRDRCRR